jgi:hypothetical protein
MNPHSTCVGCVTAQPNAPFLSNLDQGGFIQEKKNARALVLSLQTPSNEFGAKSESPLKWTE